MITGATGFLGEQFVRELKYRNIEFFTCGRRSITGVENIFCELEDPKLPDRIFDGASHVFHMAGLAHDIRKNSLLSDYMQINYESTIRLASLAASSGVQKFIFVSSVKAGGEPQQGHANTELDDSDPKDPYARSKRESEKALRVIASKTDMKVVILRPALIYGPGMKGNLRNMLTAINEGWFPPLPVIGNKRSYIHVGDVVRAMLFVAEEKTRECETFILSESEPVSTQELEAAIRRGLGKTVPRWNLPLGLFTFAASLGNISRGIFPFDNETLHKLFGDQWYSSDKICDRGFKLRHELPRDIKDVWDPR